MRWLRRALPGVRVDPPLVLLATGIAANPFYVLPSGLPQPGDFLIMAAILVMALSNRLRFRMPREAATPALLLGMFVGWVVIVSLSWSLWLTDWRVSLPAAFGVYNLAVFITILGLPYRYGPRAPTLVAVLYVFAMATVGLAAPLYYDTWAWRQEFMFNNPNQVGYFAVFSASIYGMAPRRNDLPAWLDLMVLGVAGLLVLLSASRAAFGGMVVLASLMAVGRGLRNVPLVAAVVGLLVAIPLWVTGPAETPGIEGPNMSERAERLVDVERTSERGYQRILDNPQYTLLGAGEGARYRFDTREFKFEIHSAPGTILFSYGLVGFGLILAFVHALYRQGGWPALVWLLPAILVGLTHNTLRQTDQWILLAVATLRAVQAGAPLPTPRRQARAPSVVQAR